MQISTQTEPQTLLPQLTNIKILLNIFIWVPSVSPKLRWPKLVTVCVPDPFCLWCLLLYYPGSTHPSTLTPVFPIFYGSSLCCVCVWVLFYLFFPFPLLLSEFGMCLPNTLNTGSTHSVLQLPPTSPCNYPPSCSRVTIIESKFNCVSLLVESFNTSPPYKIRFEWLMEPDQPSINILISSLCTFLSNWTIEALSHLTALQPTEIAIGPLLRYKVPPKFYAVRKASSRLPSFGVKEK